MKVWKRRVPRLRCHSGARPNRLLVPFGHNVLDPILDPMGAKRSITRHYGIYAGNRKSPKSLTKPHRFILPDTIGGLLQDREFLANETNGHPQTSRERPCGFGPNLDLIAYSAASQPDPGNTPDHNRSKPMICCLAYTLAVFSCTLNCIRAVTYTVENNRPA